MTYHRFSIKTPESARLFLTGLLILVLLSACSSPAAPQPAEALAAQVNAQSLQNPSALAKVPAEADASEPDSLQPQAAQAQLQVEAQLLLPTEAPIEPPAEPAQGLPTETQPQVGFLAPDFTLQTLDGQAVRLSDLRGQAVVVNYWASWCVPCKNELGYLSRMQAEYQGRGLLILSINAIAQDSLENVQAVISEFGMNYPVLLDQGEQFYKTYQVLFFPTTFFIDANGVIRDVALGDKSEEDFRLRVEKLLSGG